MTHKSISFVSNRFVMVLLLGSMVLLGISQYNQWQQRQKVTRQIESLRSEAKNVEDKNKQLQNSLDYLSSTSATERLAREQMNLKKEGEIAVVFVPDQNKQAEEAAPVKAATWKVWWDYFFTNNEG